MRKRVAVLVVAMVVPLIGLFPAAPAFAQSSTPTSAGSYIALGDSVAAGLGLPTKTPVTGSASRCGRTAEAYPYAVAQAMNLPLIHAACSGATAGDLFTKQRSGGPNLPPQFNSAFADGTPRLITITAGANDAHWTEFLRVCYSTNCATATSTVIANAYLAALQLKLFYVFADISMRSHYLPPTVVITGYFNPVSPACTSFSQNITSAEITWLTAEVNALNQTIQNVAAFYPFVRFAAIDYTGHDLCSTHPWVQGLNDPAPFHPTAEGQAVIAQSVLRTLGR